MTSRCFSSIDCSTSPRCDDLACGRNISQSSLRSAQYRCLRSNGRSEASKKGNGPVARASLRIENSSSDSSSPDHPQLPAGPRTAEVDGHQDVSTEFIAETLLPTSSGKFRLRGYRHSIRLTDGTRTLTEPSVIMTGQPEGKEEVVVRVHDACFTSEVLGSLKCDCADQLQLAMDFIQENSGGLIIYLQQEGRGIGLANKIAAYALQEKGVDTVDANRQLGLPDDAREYTSVLNILKDLDIRSIRLMTNNPRKIEVLESLGVKVTERIPCIVKAQQHNLGYLSTKRSRMRHLLEPELDGSYCFWNHDGQPMPASMFSDARGQNGGQNGAPVENGLNVDRTAELRSVQQALAEKRGGSPLDQQS